MIPLWSFALPTVGHIANTSFVNLPAVVDAPRGKVTLGASMANGVEEKGVENLQQCIKKCVNAGRGVLLSVSVLLIFKFMKCGLGQLDLARAGSKTRESLHYQAQ